MTRVVLFAFVALSAAQQPPARDVGAAPPRGTAIVSGVVLAGATGAEAARRARVMLIETSSAADGRAITTDDEGRFEFRDVPAGRFTIEVHKPGYLRSFYGATRPQRAGTSIPVAAGARVDGLTIRIFAGGVISGTIRDQRGRPVPGVSVTPLRFGHSFAGDRQLGSPTGGTTTDDRGAYRLWGLPPGDYLVAVDPRISTIADGRGTDFQVLNSADVDRLMSLSAGPGADMVERRANYATQFFPGTANVSHALTISVTGGEERSGIDVVVAPIPTARIRGTVLMPAGGWSKGELVTLTQSTDIAMASGGMRPRTVGLDAQGRFEFQDVAPGTYVVTVKTNRPTSPAPPGSTLPPLQYAHARTFVDGQDVQLQLQMTPAMTVSGRLVFEGTAPAEKNASVAQVYLVAPNSGGALGEVPGGIVGIDGTFKFEGVTPGPYRIIWRSQTQRVGEWWVRMAVANGRDVLDQPLVVTPGENVELVVTMTERPSELSGVFQDASGRPASEYFIVVFAVDPANWSPGSRRVRSIRPGSDGRFSIRGMPPGDYLLAALADMQNEDLHSREFLEALVPAAVRVTLIEGKTTRQDLRIGK